jgi:glycerol-3-phosphate O-acyltransferase
MATDAPNGRIHQLNGERDAIVAEVVRREMAAKGRSEAAIELAINDVAFHEIARLEGDKTKAPRLKEWLEVYRTLGRRPEEEKAKILRDLATGYACDIVGNFDPRVYRFATGVVPRGLSALFRNQLADAGGLGLEQRITVQGHVEELKSLARKGTVILVPTHLSNLDSIVIGFALDRLGLPPFTYGAGKNLFSNWLISFFMQNLGAYKVDRRLRNGLYKDVLKTYSTVVLERGYHSLFFPGGTRSRSGGIERKLKLGLLGTGLAAYVNNLREGREAPIYVVPMTINYPLVLEGASQIDDYLKATGKSRYIIEDDEFTKLGRMLTYAGSVLGFDGRMFLHVGHPMDPFGNLVDGEGRSIDPRGRPIDLRKYVEIGGEPRLDATRDAEYTRELGEAISGAFMRYNVVTTTHLAAFALFEMIKARHPALDIYHLVRLPGDTALPLHEVAAGIARLRDRLLLEAAAGRIQLSPTVQGETVERIMEVALRYFRMYHTRDLVALEGERVLLNDLKLLFYYHNRLAGYGFEAVFAPGPAERAEAAARG